MTDIEKIYEEYEDSYNYDIENEILKGLTILGKYSDDLDVNPAHDELFAGFDGMERKMSEKDVRAMFDMNWRWDEDSFVIFT